MRLAATGSMALVTAASLVAAGLSLVAGAIDTASPFRGLYFVFAAAASIAAGLAGLTARGLWRDRSWAWAILGLVGFLVAVVAWQINQSFYGDGSLLSLTPITPYLAPVGLAGVALVAMTGARTLAGRRNGEGTAS